MSSCKDIDLNREVALLEADLSLQFNLGFADSFVLGCAHTERLI